MRFTASCQLQRFVESQSATLAQFSSIVVYAHLGSNSLGNRKDARETYTFLPLLEVNECAAPDAGRASDGVLRKAG